MNTLDVRTQLEKSITETNHKFFATFKKKSIFLFFFAWYH